MADVQQLKGSSERLEADDNGYDEDIKNEQKNQYDDGSVDETFTILSV